LIARWQLKGIFKLSLWLVEIWWVLLCLVVWPQTGDTKGGSITVPLTSCLTGLESAVWQLTNCCFYLQNRLIQTSQTGGLWYSDTSPFSIPCHRNRSVVMALLVLRFSKENWPDSCTRHRFRWRRLRDAAANYFFRPRNSRSTPEDTAETSSDIAPTGFNVIKLFRFVPDEGAKQARTFVSCKPSQMLAVKKGICPQGSIRMFSTQTGVCR